MEKEAAARVISPGKWLSIIGDRASGKTTVLARLAEEMNLPSYDLDEVISRRVGRNHNAFFKLYGERRFREQEELALHSLPNSPIVVSCGGGTCFNTAAMKLMRKKARFLFLDVPASVLISRRKNGEDSRPLLKNYQSIEEEVSGLYESRRETYLRIADWTIPWKGENQEMMVTKILNFFKQEYGLK